jgi:chorismate mutase
MPQLKIVRDELDIEKKDRERLERIEEKIDKAFENLAYLLAKRVEYKEKEKNGIRSDPERF